MKVAVAACLVLALCGSGALAAAEGPHPVEKVIKMLKGLATKAEEEGKEEAVLFEKFAHWCRNSLKTLSKAIEKEKETISTLESDIEGKEKQEATLVEEIDELQAQQDENTAAGKKADGNRREAADLYSKADKDYTSTIEAMGSAITELKGSKPGAALLAQPRMRQALELLEVATKNESQRANLAVLLQEGRGFLRDRPELEAKGDYEAHVQQYDFKSDNVIELLKQLKESFEEQSRAATLAETKSVKAHELATQALEEAMDAMKASEKAKSKALETTRQDLTDYRADLKTTKDDLAADSASQEETQKSCNIKKQEWEDRSSVREQELEAMAVASKILAKVAGVRTAAPENPVPPPAPGGAVLLQIAEDPRTRAVNLLRAAVRTTHSRALERLAGELLANPDAPFNQVSNMIQKMIFRLKDEQADEDNHKIWCDNEIAKTNTSEETKSDKLEELSTRIRKEAATVQQLSNDIQKAQEMVADITAFMEEATEIRQVGKRENELAIKDSEEAQSAIAEATSVLESFFKESGMIEKADWEFLQRGVDLPDSPSTWDSSYTGVADPSKNQPDGILTVLKQTASEFAKMEADTRAQESTDQQNYEEQMQSSGNDKARRSKEAEVKEQEKKRVVASVETLTKSKKHVSGQLEAVRQYLKDLQPACVDGDSSYEDRKTARAKEVEALRQVEGILADAFKEAGASALAVSSSPRQARRGPEKVFLGVHGRS